jgi:hypothetical protein
MDANEETRITRMTRIVATHLAPSSQAKTVKGWNKNILIKCCKILRKCSKLNQRNFGLLLIVIHEKNIWAGSFGDLILFSFAQSVEKNTRKTLKVSADSFLVKFSSYPEIIPMKFGKKDTVDMGTDGTLGMTATIYYDKDSITIPYKNLPYAQVHYIPIQSPNRRVIYRLHFNGVNAYFPSVLY